MDKEARTFPKEGTARPLGAQGPLRGLSFGGENPLKSGKSSWDGSKDGGVSGKV